MRCVTGPVTAVYRGAGVGWTLPTLHPCALTTLCAAAAHPQRWWEGGEAVYPHGTTISAAPRASSGEVVGGKTSCTCERMEGGLDCGYGGPHGPRVVCLLMWLVRCTAPVPVRRVTELRCDAARDVPQASSSGVGEGEQSGTAAQRMNTMPSSGRHGGRSGSPQPGAGPRA
jgi:hypothetical protein